MNIYDGLDVIDKTAKQDVKYYIAIGSVEAEKRTVTIQSVAHFYILLGLLLRQNTLVVN